MKKIILSVIFVTFLVLLYIIDEYVISYFMHFNPKPQIVDLDKIMEMAMLIICSYTLLLAIVLTILFIIYKKTKLYKSEIKIFIIITIIPFLFYIYQSWGYL